MEQMWKNGHDTVLNSSDGCERWRCRKCGCRVDVQLSFGTWLEHSRLSNDKVLILILKILIILLWFIQTFVL